MMLATNRETSACRNAAICRGGVKARQWLDAYRLLYTFASHKRQAIGPTKSRARYSTSVG